MELISNRPRLRAVPSVPEFVAFARTEIDQTIPKRFARQVARHGERLAVRTPEASLTYAELERRTSQLARRILAARPTRSGPVALLFGHGIDMVVAVIASLKAGRAYVPLDASYPAERLRFMRRASSATLLLAGHANAELAAATAGEDCSVMWLDAASGPDGGDLPVPASDPDALAYVLFTSGSTGTPKLVPQTHRNVLHHIRMWTNSLAISFEDRLTVQSAFSWDSSVQDIFGALLNGAALFPVNVKASSMQDLARWLIDERVTVYHSTVPIFRMLAKQLRDESSKLSAMRVIALGGDPIHSSDVELYRASTSPRCCLVNAYGATETSSALLSVVDQETVLAGSLIDVGFPAEETEVSLVDPDGVVVVEGEGEILVASRYVSPGYLHPAPGEPSRIAVHPRDPQQRIYRTGDIGRRLSDGSILLSGRVDAQVKIRGMRVELGEVEGALKRSPIVSDAVVTALEGSDGERFLAAYLVLEEGASTTVTQLRKALEPWVPPHAIPARYTFLKSLPLTPNGKIDRLRLPDPSKERPALDVDYAAPVTDLERLVAKAWQHILQLDEVGTSDSFFELGGSSLRLLAVQAELRQSLGTEIPIVEMYRHPTIRALVGWLEQKAGRQAVGREPLEKGRARADRRAGALLAYAGGQQSNSSEQDD